MHRHSNKVCCSQLTVNITSVAHGFPEYSFTRASDRCAQEKRKTINGEDILYAMSTLGFDSYVEPLKTYLHKYRDVSALLIHLPTSYEILCKLTFITSLCQHI